MFYENIITLEDAIKQNKISPLETFQTPYTADNNSGCIRIVFPEFTCVCPKTGYPDFATIFLCYLPNELCVELKSWKLYLNSFRNIGTFHEAVTHHLFTTLKDLLKPKWLLLKGDFFPRGNVSTTILFETDSARPVGADVLL